MRRKKQINSTTNQSWPSSRELAAAQILAKYFHTSVKFIKPSDTHKTPDVLIKGEKWEIKSPIGHSRKTMQNNLRKAYRQSPYIVMDLRRHSQDDSRLIRRIKSEAKTLPQIKKLLVIDKKGKVQVIK